MPQTTFNHTGGWQKFNVPNGVEVLTVTLKGGGSGTRQGGWVNGRMRVNPKQDLFILVGEGGNAASGDTGGGTAFGGGGRGGDGNGTGSGGAGGGGASAIRVGSRTGRIRVVAGGAGGTAGDGALGGRGGGKVGEGGKLGTPGPEVTEASTGGTQIQPGQGGTSALGTDYWGNPGADERLGRGGRGGHPAGDNVHGGGGGGGGYYPGGGGAAGRPTISAAGGGGGGANFVGGLFSSSEMIGGGGLGNGQVVISWMDPDDPNNPPVPPENITIEGQPISDELPTKAKYSVTLKGTPDDPNHKQDVRLYVKMSQSRLFNRFSVWKGTYDKTEKRDIVLIGRAAPGDRAALTQDTLYYLRIHTQDKRGVISRNYRATSFWTNRKPLPPDIISPPENAQFTSLVNITFQWDHNDADPSDSQTAFRLRYRTAPTPITEAGDWTQVEEITNLEQWVEPAGTFKGNVLYEWQVKTRDEQDRWGEWSDFSTFFVVAETTSPKLTEPIHNEAIVAAEDNDFTWQFRTPSVGTVQEKADLRYRVADTVTWTTLTGDIVEPGALWRWTIPADTFEVGFRYEWQVRTYGVGDTEPSDWSDSAFFWGVSAPESGAGIEVIASGLPQRPIGVGHNRVFLYERGGIVQLGEIPVLARCRWNRKRDDISHCVFSKNEFEPGLIPLLSSIRTWRHEIVVFRDGERVWEGPITRITTSRGFLEIEAKDVMGYVYRRVMRQGYNDSYRVMNGQQIGQKTVVERAARIVMNALAYDDPNVLAYLTPLYESTDAKTSRIVKDYTKTAWEEIDNLAATAGLDYVTIGRRILFWDTHQPVGRLPEMRDGDFADPPIVTEYGMSAANHFGVTNNDGVYGTADSGLEDGIPPEGFIEQLASAYGEAEAVATERQLSRADRTRLEETLSEQAERNIANRWPPPVHVRVPDNTTLSPTLNVGINQLVPGVWIPVRSNTGLREVAQWQKLDFMEVTEEPSGEKISVIMSPAPNGGEDPDAEIVEE